jgi:hypothetical protein
MIFFWIPVAVIVIFALYVFWRMSKNISDALADIRHGKGIFLTFSYLPGEWKYYTQTLPLSCRSGKVCFTRKHIYISDGSEEILYDILGAASLREIFRDPDFLNFTVRNQPLSTTESGEWRPDSSDNLQHYQILIPKAQQPDADKLISFYQPLIAKKLTTDRELIERIAKTKRNH